MFVLTNNKNFDLIDLSGYCALMKCKEINRIGKMPSEQCTLTAKFATALTVSIAEGMCMSAA